MTLSPIAARALEQVKMGLYMLRGADYFSEEDWVKIDGLIHKGQYVFTNGPQRNVVQESVLDEQLINFDDPNEQNDFSVQIPSRAFEPIKEETVEITEREISSPVMSEPADSTYLETPVTTSAEVSSDDEPSPSTTVDLDSAKSSHSTEPAPTPKREPTKTPANGGLTYYTQEQLDEVKAFNAGLTKAGQKSKPSRQLKRSEEAYPSSAWSQNEASEPAAYKSPAPTEHETRTQIQSWASEVQSEEDRHANTIEIAAPAPTKKWAAEPPIAPKAVLETFKKIHGRDPKCPNEIPQPNNPEFRPLTDRPLTARPYSRMSNRALRRAAATPGPSKPASKSDSSLLEVKPGTILVAQKNRPKTSSKHLDIVAGDQIKYLTKVSGQTHSGENLRTGHRGHFTTDIVTKGLETSDALIQQQRAMAAKALVHARGTSISTVSNGMDRLEAINAAEWDEVASVSDRKTSTIGRTTSIQPADLRRPTAAGLGASRFADEDESVQSGSENQEFQGMSKEEISQLVDERFAQILSNRGKAAISVPSRPSSRIPHKKPPLTDPLKKNIVPKTATCWYWRTPNRDCRFTAEECRDLHGYLPSSDIDPPNMRMGKPTWGAAADFISSSSEVGGGVNGMGPKGQANIGLYKSKTCWYWANDSSGCTNPAEECKYLHERCAGGVANKPIPWKGSRPVWRRETSVGENWEDDGEKEKEGEWGYVKGSSTAGWEAEGSVTAAAWGWEGDVYKPPHIKALAEAVGW